uniref:beta-ketoacyl synthase N-terminal-like domain-containing protein n=1 Tax=Bradyrhizobium sp. SZCCHNRI2049 TaxID=3057287 RepID=UPI002916EBA1
LAAFYRANGAAASRVVVMSGEVERLRAALARQEKVAERTTTTSNREDDRSVVNRLEEKAIWHFKKVLASAIKLPVSRIEADVSLEEYGIDSILAVQLTSELEKSFGSLSKTLLFEYRSVQQIAEYFIDAHPERLAVLLGSEERSDTPASGLPVRNVPELLAQPVKPNRRQARFAPKRHPVLSNRETMPLDIAIIGLSGRYPQARNLDELWLNLREGKDCITEVPGDRWNHSLYFDAEKMKPGKTYSKWGGFIDGVDEFDPLFFNISPREAEFMDPHQRLFLESVWKVLETSGHTRTALQQRYQRRVGVYVGAAWHQYRALSADGAADAASFLHSHSGIANRVSAFFDLHGPSIAVDTLCSSSGLAIHMACNDLIRGECSLAIAGGVNLSIHPGKYVALSQIQMIGSRSNSRAFSDGDGYLPSETVGAVLLKPLSRAVEDGDSVLAVIKSTATSHSGRTGSMPDPAVYERLLEDNFATSGIDPRTVSYVESAANGSSISDAVEFKALTKVFQKYTADEGFCAIGSIKSNIGHAEAASAISQLSKVVLQLQHRTLVPSIRPEPRNPDLNFDRGPFYFQSTVQDWRRPEITVSETTQEVPRRAILNSIGAGGSNVSMIIEEYVPSATSASWTATNGTPRVIIFSAKNEERLMSLVGQMREYIGEHEDLCLRTLAYTLQLSREEMECRVAFVVDSLEDLVRGMETYLAGVVAPTGDLSPPFYAGNIDEVSSGAPALVSSATGNAAIETHLAENRWDKIATAWVRGARIPWHMLYQGERPPQQLLLPTYPFARTRYWVSSSKDAENAGSNPTDAAQQRLVRKVSKDLSSVENHILQRISQMLDIPYRAINPNVDLRKYGLDSIGRMKLRRDIEDTFGIALSGRDILVHGTVQALSAHIVKTLAEVQGRSAEIRQRDQLTTEERSLNALVQFKHGTISEDLLLQIIDNGVVL